MAVWWEFSMEASSSKWLVTSHFCSPNSFSRSILEEFTTAGGSARQTWALGIADVTPKNISTCSQREKIDRPTKIKMFFPTHDIGQVKEATWPTIFVTVIPMEMCFCVNDFDPQRFSTSRNPPGSAENSAPAYRRGSRRALAPWPGPGLEFLSFCRCGE